jgi:hypothetical protein
MTPTFTILPRDKTIAQLIEDCAAGKIPFQGEGSLWQKVRQMGYSCNGLYEMVCAAESRRRGGSGADATPTVATLPR